MRYSYTERVRIAAPIERIFDYRLDLCNLPFYNPDVSGVTLVGCAPCPQWQQWPRHRFRLRLAPGLHCRVAAEVVAAEHPYRIELRIDSIVDACEICRFEKAGDATDVEFETRLELPSGRLMRMLCAAIVIPLGRSQTRRELRRLKAILEYPHPCEGN